MMNFVHRAFFLQKRIGYVYCRLDMKNLLFLQHMAINNLKFPVCFYNTSKWTKGASEVLSRKCDCAGDLQGTFSEDILRAFERSLNFRDLEESDLKLVYRRFGMEGLNIAFISNHNVRVSPDFTSLLFPFSSLENDFAAIQMIQYDDVTENITHSFTGDDQALFGWSLIGPERKELVVTSDPLDAITVNQCTNIPTVSLPFVKASSYSFSLRLLGLFNAFNKVIFWMKRDLHNFQNHKLLRKILKRNVYFVRPREFQNPLCCLKNGSDISHIVKKSYPLLLPRVNLVEDKYRDAVFEDLHPNQNSGLEWKRFSALNEVLKGHRLGELTVFSGQTGTGKTTFMSEYSLDLCLQSRPTLWINLEIKYSRLIRTMLCQFSRSSPQDVYQAFDIWMDRFEDVPMVFLDFSEDYSINGIFSDMLSALHSYDIEHIVVDNLQFMMNMGEYSSNIDTLRRQDLVYAKFRDFATRWNCHVTVIIHPRKEPEYSELSVSSISGTSKATQEADNVLILQTTKSRQYLQVTKNRFDGEKGCILLEFDKKTFTYTMKKLKSKMKTLNVPVED